MAAYDTPTLKDILALRPADGSVEGIRIAISNAEALREKALNISEAAKQEAKSQLLIGSLTTIQAAERQAEEADLAADRCSAILDELRSRLAPAVAADAEAGRAALVTAAIEADAAYVALWHRHFAAVAELAAKILTAKRAADTAITEAGQMDSLPRWEAFTVPLPGRVNPVDVVLSLANFAPTEIARRDEEYVTRDAADRERRRIESEDHARRAAIGREQNRLADAELEARNTANRIPTFPRLPVHISGEGW